MQRTTAGFVVVLVFLLGVIALGAKWLGAWSSRSHVVVVTGESRVVGEPDTALVMFGVEKSARTVAEAQQRVSQLMDRTISALQAAGVKKEDVATSDLRIDQGWDYEKNAPKGFTVTNTITVTVRDVQRVGRIIDTAVASGLNRLQGVQYDVRSRAWEEKALRQAIDDARDKAGKIASAAGRPLGRVVSLRQEAQWEASPEEEYYATTLSGTLSWRQTPLAGASQAMPATRALPGQRSLTLQVEVVYQL